MEFSKRTGPPLENKNWIWYYLWLMNDHHVCTWQYVQSQAMFNDTVMTLPVTMLWHGHQHTHAWRAWHCTYACVTRCKTYNTCKKKKKHFRKYEFILYNLGVCCRCHNYMAQWQVLHCCFKLQRLALHHSSAHTEASSVVLWLAGAQVVLRLAGAQVVLRLAGAQVVPQLAGAQVMQQWLAGTNCAKEDSKDKSFNSSNNYCLNIKKP